MDLDPSEFLSMAMSEDQDAVYTAPDVQESCPSIAIPQGMITVEGGLEMENDVQLTIPTFDTLDMSGLDEYNDSSGMLPNGDNFSASLTNGNLGVFTNVDSPTHEQNGTEAQPSPIERTGSPLVGKKIPVTYDEQRFRKDLFNGNFERVKLFRLHCSICDKHLGCAPRFTERQMRLHKLYSVSVCRKCFDFYGDINFPITDGSEIYCSWCGEGGELYCCITCPKAVCKRCIKRNFGNDKVQEVEDNDNWSCFVCKPNEIWPHRAIMWGLQRFGKQMRQKVASLEHDEKERILSTDTAHCCLKLSAEITPVGLPPKIILSKIPLCLITVTYLPAIRNQPDIRVQTDTVRPTNGPFTNYKVGPMVTKNISQIGRPAIQGEHMVKNRHPTILKNCLQPPRLDMLANARPASQMLYRAAVNRSTSQLLMLGMKNTPRPTIPYSKSFSQIQKPLTSYMRNLPVSETVQPSEIIDLVDESEEQQVLDKPSYVNYDISWLENGIKKLNQSLQPLNQQLERFNFISRDLKTDLSKIDSYFNNLSNEMKVAIINLAKVNQDMIERKKMALDNTVLSVVNDIQRGGNYNSITLSNGIETHSATPPPLVSFHPSVRADNKNPLVRPSLQDLPSKTDSNGGDEEPVYVNPALLCETVLEVDINKENNCANKVSKPADCITTPRKATNSTQKRGRPRSKKNFNYLTLNKTGKIQVIDISENNDDDVPARKRSRLDLIKKFNIKPCTVVLERLKLKA